MRTLIIPDLHNRIDWADGIIAAQEYSRAVFLGDYFDAPGDSAFEAIRTAHWLKRMLRDPRNILLLGNHDLHYAFPSNESLRTPGFTSAKARAIRDILTSADWSRFRLFHFEQGFLLSHAGICLELFGGANSSLTLGWIEERCGLALQRAAAGKFDPVLREGGGAAKGGITWLYWDDFSPIPGWNQIVGHSCGREVRVMKTESGGAAVSENYCIDCGGDAYGVLVNGVFGPITS